MNEPKFQIGENVRLVNDDLDYVIVNLFKDQLIFKYKIISKDLTYHIIANELDLESIQ